MRDSLAIQGKEILNAFRNAEMDRSLEQRNVTMETDQTMMAALLHAKLN